MTLTIAQIRECKDIDALKGHYQTLSDDADSIRAEIKARRVAGHEAEIEALVRRLHHRLVRLKAIEEQAEVHCNTILRKTKLSKLAELQVCIDRQKAEIAQLRAIVDGRLAA